MRATIGPLGEVGIVKDQAAHLLPLNAWTDGRNVSFRDGKVVRSFGYLSTLTPGNSPFYAQYCPTATGTYWLYAGLTDVYATDVTSHADITRSSGGPYGATANLNWTGGNLGGVPVINNGVDAPQMWLTPSLATPLAALSNWPASTICQSLRPFKNYLVALDLTESVTRYPQMVRWSHPADPGGVPASWDYTDPAYDAGRIELKETSDFLVDQMVLRDTNILYKEFSTWGMRFIGGNDIFQFFKIFDSFGALSRRCALEFQPGQHVVFTPDDCVVHDGNSAESILQRRVRRSLFSGINSDYLSRCFVASSWLTQEVYFCYPEGSDAYCTLALVWNWKDNTLSFRELPSITHIANGVVDFSGVSPSVWDTDSEAWDSDTTTWDFSEIRATDRRMLWTKPGSALYGAPYGLTADSGVIDSWVIREGLGLPARQDQPPDFTTRKLVKRIWPHVSGDTGTTIQIYVGAKERIEAATVWYGPYPFVIGTTLWIDCLVNARLHGFQFYCSENKNWELTSFDVEYSAAGGQ